MNRSLNQKFHFHSYLKHLLAVLSSFTDLTDRFAYPFIYFNSEPPRLRYLKEYPCTQVISPYMLHGSRSFYLSWVISVSKVIQREKWNQALYKRRIELLVSKNQKADVQSTFNIPLNCRQICIKGEGKTSSL